MPQILVLHICFHVPTNQFFTRHHLHHPAKHQTYNQLVTNKSINIGSILKTVKFRISNNYDKHKSVTSPLSSSSSSSSWTSDLDLSDSASSSSSTSTFSSFFSVYDPTSKSLLSNFRYFYIIKYFQINSYTNFLL